MAPGTLQLFPPPEKPMQRPLPPMWPTRVGSRRDAGRLHDLEPTIERMESAKSQVDFHELIIRVNSSPNSPVEVREVPRIEAPKKARLPNLITSPEQTHPTFDSPSHASNWTARSPPRIQTGRAISPAHSEMYSQNASAPVIMAAPPQRRVVSPTPSEGLPSRRDAVVSPASPSTLHARTVSPSLYEDQNGIIGLAISPESPAANPEQRRVASPAQSDVISALSESPTLVRSNSVATVSSIAKPRVEEPVMRSIFPRYNPNVTLAQQAYAPMLTTPPSRIPREQISRPLNSPKYTPHSNIESIDDMDPAPRSSAAIPYYTPPTALDSLWDATNGQGNPVVQVYTLQIHRKTSRNSEESQIIFGPSESQPFYTLSHSDLPHNLLDEDEDVADHELLITRHNPSRVASFPIAHFTLSPTPSTSKSVASSSPELCEFPEPPALITTIYPKMAALTALDAAAQSPAASRIALVDPDASSPAAERLAQDVLLGTAERECCALIWTKSGYSQPSHFAPTSPGSYSLHHPSLGIFPIIHEGDTTPGLSPILGNNPFTSNKQLPRKSTKPTRISLLNPFATPAEDRRPDTPSDDAVLARLDFGSDSLVLNTAAMLRLGNPYFIDVAVSTLLAVALAEEKRVRREIRFEAPPLVAVPTMRSSGPSDGKKEKKSFWNRLGKRAEKKVRQKVKIDPSIDLEAWGTPPKEAVKGKDEEEELPFVTTAILGILTFTFKTTVWVLGITIKIVGGVIVKVSHWIVKEA